MNTSKKLELIDEIKKRPVLYDRNHIHFHDYHSKEHLWNWLSRKFNINAKKKWGTLRDKFVRLKREKTNNDTNKIVETWDLYEPLSFLHNYCRPRKRKIPITSFKADSPTTPDTTNHEFEFAIVSHNDDHHLSMEESQELTENNYISDSTSNHSGISEFDSTAKKIKTEILPENRKYITTADFANSKSEHLIYNDTENMLFMKMIGKKLELLPNKDKNKVQIKILQLVNEELDKSDK